MSDTQDSNSVIDRGAAVAEFLSSPVGILITERADEEERAALEALAIAEPTDSRRIRELQNEVWRANSIVGWLKQAIEEAVAAHNAQKEEERLPE